MYNLKFLPRAGVSSSTSRTTAPVRNDPGKYSKVSESKWIMKRLNFRDILFGKIESIFKTVLNGIEFSTGKGIFLQKHFTLDEVKENEWIIFTSTHSLIHTKHGLEPGK